jgi:lipoprotein-releasing system ATP-binding protein
MLKITGLSKSYPQRGTVLNRLGLEVSKGETIAITGPSGSGKTTLLNIIGLLDRPDSGKILFDGNPVLDYSENEAAKYRNSKIGFVFQDHLLLPHLTLKENILLPLLARKEKELITADISAYLDMLMKAVGIEELADEFPSVISGGEAQRASILRALIGRPSLLLADEPTGSLDTDNASALAELLLELNSRTGTTLITVTHSDMLAGRMAKRYRLTNGSLVQY